MTNTESMFSEPASKTLKGSFMVDTFTSKIATKYLTATFWKTIHSLIFVIEAALKSKVAYLVQHLEVSTSHNFHQCQLLKFVSLQLLRNSITAASKQSATQDKPLLSMEKPVHTRSPTNKLKSNQVWIFMTILNIWAKVINNQDKEALIYMLTFNRPHQASNHQIMKPNADILETETTFTTRRELLFKMP